MSRKSRDGSLSSFVKTNGQRHQPSLTFSLPLPLSASCLSSVSSSDLDRFESLPSSLSDPTLRSDPRLWFRPSSDNLAFSSCRRSLAPLASDAFLSGPLLRSLLRERLREPDFCEARMKSMFPLLHNNISIVTQQYLHCYTTIFAQASATEPFFRRRPWIQ